MGTRSRFALVALAVVIAVLVIAVPAQASTVAKGSSNMTISPAVTHALVGQHITVEPIAPATRSHQVEQVRPDVLVVPRSDEEPAAAYNATTGVGKFLHSGFAALRGDEHVAAEGLPR